MRCAVSGGQEGGPLPDHLVTVLGMNADGWLEDTRISYDTVAASYADLVRDSLEGALYLRSALGLFADLVRASGGPVADVGCGPGQVTALLHELGIDAFGIDLSPAMIDLARRDYPGSPRQVWRPLCL